MSRFVPERRDDNRRMKPMRDVFLRNPRAAVCWLIFLPVFAAAGGAFGATFTVRTPENFVREAGKPATVTTQPFTVPDPATSFTLVVHNGGSNNEFRRVSSAIISVNGKQILGPSDFNQQVNVIQKTVSLEVTNTMSVELRSAPGSGITVELIAADNVAPTI